MLQAAPMSGAGLGVIRRQGMAAWVRTTSNAPEPPPDLPAVPCPPLPSTSELTRLLAGLVVTLVEEPAHA